MVYFARDSLVEAQVKMTRKLMNNSTESPQLQSTNVHINVHNHFNLTLAITLPIGAAILSILGWAIYNIRNRRPIQHAEEVEVVAGNPPTQVVAENPSTQKAEVVAGNPPTQVVAGNPPTQKAEVAPGNPPEVVAGNPPTQKAEEVEVVAGNPPTQHAEEAEVVAGNRPTQQAEEAEVVAENQPIPDAEDIVAAAVNATAQ